MSTVFSKPKKVVGESRAVVFWWSTFHQRWHWTTYKGDEKQETRVDEKRAIMSDVQLIRRVGDIALRVFPRYEGKVEVVETAYSAIWYTEDADIGFLRQSIDWLICHEI